MQPQRNGRTQTHARGQHIETPLPDGRRGHGLAAFKVPDRIEFVAHFPHTGVGKVSRKDLRERLRQAWLQSAAS